MKAKPGHGLPFLRIEPGNGRHVGLLARSQFDEIGAPVSVDHEVSLDRRPRRLDHLNASRIATSAFGVPNYPAHGVASRHGT